MPGNIRHAWPHALSVFRSQSREVVPYLDSLDEDVIQALRRRRGRSRHRPAPGQLGEWCDMIKHRGQLLAFLFLISDLFLTAASWLGAYYIRCQSGWLPLDKTPPHFHLCVRQLPLVLLLAVLAHRIAGLNVVGRLRRFREE